MLSTAPGGNNLKGGNKSPTKRLLWLVALALMAGIIVYALDASRRLKGGSGSGPVPDPHLALTTGAVQKPPASPVGPKIQFASQSHDFGTTATDWSRTVEPGQTGTIPIQFNSTTFSGPVGKNIMVTCNDPGEPVVTLQLSANIWRTIEVTPQFAILSVTAESPSNTTTMRITNNMPEPLTLGAPESGNPAFAAELKTIQPGREFELIVRTVPPLPVGNVSGAISLKTSSTNIPTLTITAIANMQPVVMVMPSQISLPVAPLANPMLYTLSIRNNGTNTLALSEPAMNAKGVDVQLKELQPGRFFEVSVTFPAGFEVAQGEQVELSLKSNHPQFPVIKAPVLQPPRPVPVPPLK
jgi:hypothetical protein